MHTLMRLSKYTLLAFLLCFLLLAVELFVLQKEHLSLTVNKPDLENILSFHPASWWIERGSTADPRQWEWAYDVAANRIYKRDGKVVSVALTWSRDGIRRAGHPQEVCYNSSGFTVSQPRQSSFFAVGQKIDVITFTGQRGDMVEDVIYWSVTGGQHNVSMFQNYLMTHRFKEALNFIIGFLGSPPDNLMVRVSSWRRATDPPSTAHIEYIKAYLQAVPPDIRRFLLGDTEILK